MSATRDDLADILNSAKKREARARKQSLIYVAAAVVIGLAWIGFSYSKVQGLQTESRNLAKQIEGQRQEIEAGKQELAKLNTAIPYALREFGYSGSAPSADLVQTSLDANSAFEKLSEGVRAQRPTANIEFFAKPKDVNPERVSSALQSLGFNVQRRAAIVTDTETNTVWAGSPIPLDHVKLAALALLRAGLHLKSIYRISTTSPRSRANLIQIGGTSIDANKKDLTSDEIAKMTDVPADPYDH